MVLRAVDKLKGLSLPDLGEALLILKLMRTSSTLLQEHWFKSCCCSYYCILGCHILCTKLSPLLPSNWESSGPCSPVSGHDFRLHVRSDSSPYPDKSAVVFWQLFQDTGSGLEEKQTNKQPRLVAVGPWDKKAHWKLLRSVKSVKRVKWISEYKLTIFAYFWDFNLITIFLLSVFSVQILPYTHPILLKFITSFFIKCYCICICIWIYIYSPNYNLLNPYNVTCTNAFGADHLAVDNNRCSPPCGGRTFHFQPYSLGCILL